MSKVLVVLGATGKQGGSVISSILNDATARSTFQLRGITRDITKPAAKALSAKGVEMVSADLGDKAALSKAFEGAYAVFAVTDYWATMDGETEIRQGKNAADAAKAVGVKHYVWSTLINVTKGESLCPPFCGKPPPRYHMRGIAIRIGILRSAYAQHRTQLTII